MPIDLATLTLFAGALIITAASPGPSVASLVSRVITRGWKDVLPFAAAMWIGEVLWLSAAIFGLAALAESLHWAFVVLKYLGVAYLLYLAWSMWHAPTDTAVNENQAGVPGSPIRMFLAGLFVTLGNPKIMVFYLALLPNLIDLRTLGVGGWLELSLTVLVLLAVIDLSWMLLAVQARRLLRRPRVVKVTNRVGAVCMGGAAVGIAAK